MSQDHSEATVAPLPIPHTLKVISDCWTQAESETRREIKIKFHDSPEEFITRLFFGELRYALDKASRLKKIERAFLKDLQATYDELGWFNHVNYNFKKFAEGIVVVASPHSRRIEQFTGGDFGVIVSRPIIEILDNYRLAVENRLHSRGILCQAKIKRSDGKWGTFTPNQKKVLPSRMSYFGLCLYEYEDEPRCRLKPFQWQISDGHEIKDFIDSLKNDSFSNTRNSSSTLEALGADQIGTSNMSELGGILDPQEAIKVKTKIPCIDIRIDWPAGSRPAGAEPEPFYFSYFSSLGSAQSSKPVHNSGDGGGQYERSQRRWGNSEETPSAVVHIHLRE